VEFNIQKELGGSIGSIGFVTTKSSPMVTDTHATTAKHPPQPPRINIRSPLFFDGEANGMVGATGCFGVMTIFPLYLVEGKFWFLYSGKSSGSQSRISHHPK
jgi:hypothetical protein